MQISNRLARLIRDRKPALGFWINLSDPGVAQIAALAGFDGAGGVMVPGIRDADDARQAVHFSKYAPLGMRGYGPNRATGFWTHQKDYNARANNRARKFQQRKEHM